MFDREFFLRWQLRAMIAIGLVSLLALLLIEGSRGFRILVLIVPCLLFIFAGSRLFRGDTSENWHEFSVFQTLRDCFGAVLILFGWAFFLRGVVAATIGAIILWMG